MKKAGLLKPTTDPEALAKRAWLDLDGVTDEWVNGLKVEKTAAARPALLSPVGFRRPVRRPQVVLRRLLLHRRMIRGYPDGRASLSLECCREPRPAPRRRPSPSRPVAARPSATAAPRRPAVAAAAAALAALAVHLFLPNGQTPAAAWTDALPAWRHPYPGAARRL